MNCPFVQVPVSAYIKKFIDSFFGDPVMLDDSSSHRVALKVFLSYNMQQDIFFEKSPLRELPNTVHLEIVRRKYQNIYIRKQNLQQIVKYFDRIFEEEMHRHINQFAKRQSHTNGYKHELEHFCKLHGIEIFQDIEEDALIKQYYRYTQVQKISKSLRHPKAEMVAA